MSVGTGLAAARSMMVEAPSTGFWFASYLLTKVLACTNSSDTYAERMQLSTDCVACVCELHAWCCSVERYYRTSSFAASSYTYQQLVVLFTMPSS